MISLHHHTPFMDLAKIALGSIGKLFLRFVRAGMTGMRALGAAIVETEVIVAEAWASIYRFPPGGGPQAGWKRGEFRD